MCARCLNRWVPVTMHTVHICECMPIVVAWQHDSDTIVSDTAQFIWTHVF
jgi:hypothetical protein